MAAPPLVARKINREAVVLLGWGRAILLQVAHPLVAAAVRDYSDFSQSAGGYVRRVRRTVGGMLSITFGEPAEARAAVERINAIHRRVHGALRERVGVLPAGTPYAATDPHLLLWVHATLVESMLVAYERFVGPLSFLERDAFCAEAAETARWFGVPEETLPLTAADLDQYFRRMYSTGEIAVGDDARALAQALFAPPLGPAVPMFRVTKLLTLGLLPAPIRAQYGFEWDARRERTFHTLASLVRRVRALLPPLLREWPIARRAA
jgi:uncharacterized protein (DUF2236 family)